ncbi:MAG TPA: hypothetical protein VEC38_09300 [Candidatus Binataceae bacterium]|nr:hypothetical protein [Candidatus Binataceae bacterium]
MRSNFIAKVLAVGIALGLSGCAVVEAQRQAEEAKKQVFVKRVDIAHIWVTTGVPGPNKPYTVLGDVKYTEPFSPEAIDETNIKEKLKKIAYDKWPETIDGIIKENQEVSPDGSTVTVSGQAIQYESSVDREALHKLGG